MYTGGKTKHGINVRSTIRSKRENMRPAGMIKTSYNTMTRQDDKYKGRCGLCILRKRWFIQQTRCREDKWRQIVGENIQKGNRSSG